MNPYAMLGSSFDMNDATSLCARLTAWHDAMVAHERQLRAGHAADSCDDECPHGEARTLWAEAVAAFGPRAHELIFLRARALGTPQKAAAASTVAARRATIRAES